MVDGDGTPPRAPRNVLTLPNALSFARLLGVPVFLWLILSHRDGWALALVMVSGWTDYFDGLLARRLHQESRLGQLLDPTADRLYILATLLGLTLRHIVPVELTASLLLRDLLLTGCLLLLYLRGFGPLPVHYLGKAATFNLLYAFPLLLLGDGDGTFAQVCGILGWAFVIWGSSLYWWAALVYVAQVRSLLVTSRSPEGPAPDLLGAAGGSGPEGRST
jgi:cardiolipin synthase